MIRRFLCAIGWHKYRHVEVTLYCTRYRCDRCSHEKEEWRGEW